jgi:hypothetical protein
MGRGKQKSQNKGDGFMIKTELAMAGFEDVRRP